MIIIVIFYAHYNYMQPNSSFIDILRNLQQDEPLTTQSSPLTQLQKCDSFQLHKQPLPGNLSIQPVPTNQIKTQRKMPTTDGKRNSFMIVGNNSNKISQQRHDQMLFQVKLKLASFVARFNIDNQCLVNVREQSVEVMLDLVFKKFKEFKKQHQALLKACNQSLKCKQIQILNLQSKLSNTEQLMCQQSNKWSRMRQKLREQQSHAQLAFEANQTELQTKNKTIYMLQQITKQQNDYIKHLQSEQSQQFSSKQIALENQLSTLNSKYAVVSTENKQLREQVARLTEENRKINEEIMEVMDTNKQYKSEAMMAREKEESSRTQIQGMEQKLIAYFQIYKAEVTKNEIAESKIKQLLFSLEKSHSLQSEVEKLAGITKKMLLQKQALVLQKQEIRKQNQSFRRDCQVKQIQIMKLNKTLSELVQSYSNRPQTKKVRSQMELPSSSESQDRQKYRISINGSINGSISDNFVTQYRHEKGRREGNELKKQNKQMERLKEIYKEKHDYFQNKIKSIEEENELKMKGVIKEWKLKLENTVEYYENYIEALQKQQKEFTKAKI